MKVIGTRELREELSDVIDKAQKGPVVVTRHGAPAILITGVEDLGLDEIELGTDDRIWRELEARRHNPQLIPFESAKRSWGTVRRK